VLADPFTRDEQLTCCIICAHMVRRGEFLSFAERQVAARDLFPKHTSPSTVGLVAKNRWKREHSKVENVF